MLENLGSMSRQDAFVLSFGPDLLDSCVTLVKKENQVMEGATGAPTFSSGLPGNAPIRDYNAFGSRLSGVKLQTSPVVTEQDDNDGSLTWTLK